MKLSAMAGGGNKRRRKKAWRKIMAASAESVKLVMAA
jgi:hypothetical protein